MVPMPIPAVIAVDLDGTLLRSDGGVSARTRAAVDLAQAAGVRIVVVTARPPRFVDLLVAEVGLSGVAVCSNGAIVYDPRANAAKIVGPLPLDLARGAVAVIEAALPQAGFAVETGWRVLCEPAYRHVSTRDEARIAVPSRDELWSQAESLVKLLVWAADCDIDVVLALLAQALPGLECTYSGGAGLLEISAAGVTKAATLAALCADWGVPSTAVVAFGDMPNDLPVLRWAGTAYAVANAHPAVLAQVPRHTASNDDDGVAQVIEQLLG
jgi:hypothetical protein